MSRYTDPTTEQEAAYAAWVAARPPAVRAVAERFTPWDLYRMKSTGHRVVVLAFEEEGDTVVTLRVLVSAAFNLIAFERQVFGINPDDLEPCNPPDANDPIGALLGPEEVVDNLDTMRLLARPDIWERDPETGAAIRRQTPERKPT